MLPYNAMHSQKSSKDNYSACRRFSSSSCSSSWGSRSADGRPSSCQTHTSALDTSASKHWRISVEHTSQYVPHLLHPKTRMSLELLPGDVWSYLNISGTIKNRTWLPLMYTWSRWLTRPSRAVTVISLSWTFMLSSAIVSVSPHSCSWCVHRVCAEAIADK